MHSDDSLGRSEDDERGRTSEITKIKKEIETAERIFYEELSSKYFLLERFSIEQLKEMCNKLLGKGPDLEYYEDKSTKKIIELPQYKEDYIHFIIDEFQFHEIKDYALQKHIVTNNFFHSRK